VSGGALEGVRIVELAAIGPAPYGVMLLADLGAEVVRVDRIPDDSAAVAADAAMVGLARNRRSIAIDVRHDDGAALVRRLATDADVLVEGMRPGVAERLGLGPDVLLEANPGLIYTRATGWGQDGPLAARAGHDIDYAAVAGALHAVGRADEPPPPPVNYLADLGGGGTFVAIGVLAALVERERSGRGQVVDAAMVDGTASLTAFLHGLLSLGAWSSERGSNLLDGGAPFYDTYRCADGGFVAVGAIEPAFYAALCDELGLDVAEWPQHDRGRWPALRAALAGRFAQAPRDEWARRFADLDACVAPVLAPTEAPDHPHNVARSTFVEVEGCQQPAPAPRLSRTPGAVRSPPPEVGGHTTEILAELGITDERATMLRAAGVVA
jgi:alpha-methylacyl-CoA racemase